MEEKVGGGERGGSGGGQLNDAFICRNLLKSLPLSLRTNGLF